MPVTETMANTDIICINELIELRVETEDSVKYYRSRVEDSQGDKLIVALPVESSELVRAGIGFNLGIIKKSETGVFISKAQVAAKALEPVPLLTLRPQGQWERLQRRRDVRLQITLSPLEVIVFENGRERPVEAKILDISAGGLLIRSKERIHTFTRFKIKFELPGTPPPVEAEAEVVRVTSSEVNGWEHFNMGTRFVNLSPREKDRIVKFIFQEQIRRRRAGRM
jgi:c-di-GMP-binding flagellar brake protein YcgR